MAAQVFTDTANPQCGTTQWKLASGTVDIGHHGEVAAGELSRLNAGGQFTITAGSTDPGSVPIRVWRLPS